MSSSHFHQYEDGLLVLDEDRRRVYQLPAELIPEAKAALSQPASATSRRRFLHALAAGSLAGVVIIALPRAAAASSLAGDSGGDEEPLSPSGDVEPGTETDPDLAITRVAAGDNEVTLEWSDSTV
jgi:hypothetical protein